MMVVARRFAAPLLSDARLVVARERLLLLGGFAEASSAGLRVHATSSCGALTPWDALPPAAPCDRGGHAVATLYVMPHDVASR